MTSTSFPMASATRMRRARGHACPSRRTRRQKRSIHGTMTRVCSSISRIASRGQGKMQIRHTSGHMSTTMPIPEQIPTVRISGTSTTNTMATTRAASGRRREARRSLALAMRSTNSITLARTTYPERNHGRDDTCTATAQKHQRRLMTLFTTVTTPSRMS